MGGETAIVPPGQVAQIWVSANLGLKFITHCFISVFLQVSLFFKFRKLKLLLIQTKIQKKY